MWLLVGNKLLLIFKFLTTAAILVASIAVADHPLSNLVCLLLSGTHGKINSGDVKSPLNRLSLGTNIPTASDLGTLFGTPSQTSDIGENLLNIYNE